MAEVGKIVAPPAKNGGPWIRLVERVPSCPAAWAAPARNRKEPGGDNLEVDDEPRGTDSDCDLKDRTGDDAVSFLGKPVAESKPPCNSQTARKTSGVRCQQVHQENIGGTKRSPVQSGMGIVEEWISPAGTN